MSRPEKDEWRKQHIRAAATRCFIRRGFAATRLLDIAAEAGLSKGGVYFHYRAKEALFEDILDSQAQAIQRRWSVEPLADQPADETLRQLVEAHMKTIEEDPDETRINHLLVSMAPQDATFRNRLQETFGMVRNLYADVIRRGIEEGIFVRRNADELARCVLALVHGLAAQAAGDQDGHLTVRPETAADMVVSMVRNQRAAASVTRSRATVSASHAL